MKNTILRARQMSLALLVIAVIDHGPARSDFSGAAPNASGLVRLGRDLMRGPGKKALINQEDIDKTLSEARSLKQMGDGRNTPWFR